MSKRYIDVDVAVSNAEARYGEWVLAMAAAEGTRQVNMVYGEQHKGMFTTDRAKNRAKTFPGIAKAMSEQWG